jgi:nicotinamide-nucleotide amidase
VYGGESDSFPLVVGKLLRERGLSLAVAESATGGHLAGLITDAPGASDYFRAGYVVYTRAAKEALGVSPVLLGQYGTVSAETTVALAQAARAHSGADTAIATTGVAGPDPAEGLPVGTIHMAVDLQGQLHCLRSQYTTTRAEFKRRGALEALALLWRELK